MGLTAGTALGPYEIISALGAGGMGEVYRARDTRLDRTVAIKILASHLASSPELKQRLEREARAISSLNHPNICHLYDIGSQDGADFLVMEVVEGQTLADRLRGGALPLPEIYKIGIAVADALAFAHGRGIVHRDLKPGNIMLTQSGAKLMDFGLAKPLVPAGSGTGSASAPPSFTAVATMSGPSPLSPLTTAGTIIGTIQYMAPEQIEGKEADVRSDIFAFGAVLYEMATGKRPFEGKSQISLASAILEHDPAPISSAKPLTPLAFEHIVHTCLQKNPNERFQTAHDIKLELQWVASDKSLPSAVAAASVSVAARRPLAWVLAVIAGIGLGSAGGFFLRRQAPVFAIHMARKSATTMSRRASMTIGLFIASTCTIQISRMRVRAGHSSTCGTTTNLAGVVGSQSRNTKKPGQGKRAKSQPIKLSSSSSRLVLSAQTQLRWRNLNRPRSLMLP